MTRGLSMDWRPISLCLGLLASAAAHGEPAGAPQVTVPAGSYIRCLDCSLKSDRRTITLKSYRIDQDEVTYADYAVCVRDGACRKPSVGGEESWPVRGVSWFDADAYCKRAGRRLPTEAEWERAAFPYSDVQDGRGPRIASKYDLCDALQIGGYDHRRCRRPGKKQPRVIALKSPLWPDAAYGLLDRSDVGGGGMVFDLFGNVAEWVADWAWGGLGDVTQYYLHAIPSENPTGPPDGTVKSIRGGSYLSMEGINETERRYSPPGKRYPDVGFRCASDAPAAPGASPLTSPSPATSARPPPAAAPSDRPSMP